MATAVPAAGNGHPAAPVPSRRELFALAAVLAATVLTAGAAVSGLRRTPAPVQQSPPVVDQIIRPAPTPAPPQRVEPGD